LTQWASVPH